MFYEKKRIYSREVSKRSCKNDMNPESQTLLEVHFIFYSPFFYIDKEVCSSFCSRSTFADKNVPWMLWFCGEKNVLFEPFQNKKTVHFMCTVFWWRIAPVTRTLYSLQECILNHVRIAMILFFQKRFDRFSYDLRLRNTLADALCLKLFDHCLW